MRSQRASDERRIAVGVCGSSVAASGALRLSSVVRAPLRRRRLVSLPRSASPPPLLPRRVVCLLLPAECREVCNRVPGRPEAMSAAAPAERRRRERPSDPLSESERLALSRSEARSRPPLPHSSGAREAKRNVATRQGHSTQHDSTQRHSCHAEAPLVAGELCTLMLQQRSEVGFSSMYHPPSQRATLRVCIQPDVQAKPERRDEMGGHRVGCRRGDSARQQQRMQRSRMRVDLLTEARGCSAQMGGGVERKQNREAAAGAAAGRCALCLERRSAKLSPRNHRPRTEQHSATNRRIFANGHR